jgi:hypothetical protein
VIVEGKKITAPNNNKSYTVYEDDKLKELSILFYSEDTIEN